jgi:DNA-binding CsgD family transcriptional regulator
VYLIDVAGTLTWANVAASEVVGDRVGQSYLTCVPKDLHARARTNFARKVVGGAPTIFEVAVLDTGGGRRGFSVRSAPLRRGDRIVGVFGLAVPLRRDEPADDDIVTGGDGRPLTPRQKEVLRLLADGSSTDAIATRLGVSVETARNHIRALLRKLGVHSRLEAVVEGRRRRLVRGAEDE